MKFKVDHDYHIHSYLSLCSNDPEQNPERIMAYAKQHGFKNICLTDHYWDESVLGASSWYQAQDTAHVRSILPLPKDQELPFYFGAETDLKEDMTLGISLEQLGKLDFVIIPTTHLHMRNFTIREQATAEERTQAWISRLDGVLDMDLPFEKIGIAHLACPLIAPKDEYERVLNGVSDDEMRHLFQKAAKVGVGIEINASDWTKGSVAYGQAVRMFTIAKECGCKFYLGSDGHKPAELARAMEIFENAVEVLALTEDDKFFPFAK